MSIMSMLAQVGSLGGDTVVVKDVQIVPIDFIWEQISALTWLQAVLAISFGIVYMLYGWRIFKILVIISFALLGMFAGIFIGNKAGSPMWGGVIGLAAMGVVAAPLMKWAVCVLGAVAGSVLTGGLWYAFNGPEVYIWVAGLVGFVAGGMISFIVFKEAVMLFTSLGGSAVLVTGFLALFHVYGKTLDPPSELVHNLVHYHNWFLPLSLMVPTIIGIIVQHKFYKHSSKWEL